MIVSLLILISFFVLILLVLVFTKRLVARPAAIQVEILEEPSGRGDHPLGSELDFQEPGMQEFPTLTEPSFDLLVESLEGLLAQEESSLDTLGADVTDGSGGGDRRRAGPLGDGKTIPRADRWDIAYTETTLSSYAAQLDFFGIELGAVGGGRRGIDYVSDLTSGQPQVRHVDDTAAESRLYFTWRSGQLQQFDRQLVEQAGVQLASSRVLQFYPPEIENQLAVLERDALQGRSLDDVRKTRFGVRVQGEGFAYYVISIENR